MIRARVLAVAVLGLGCDDLEQQLIPVEPTMCLREYAPSSYAVYFVVDVSGSMAPFLADVREELLALAENLPKFDDEGRAVTVEFFIVAFVNDVRWYPGNVRRLEDVTRVQSALDEAIADGKTNQNLNAPTFNAEDRENLLDALAEVITDRPSKDANLIILATDADFAEAPDELSGSIVVRSTFSGVRAGLAEIGARVHAFVGPDTDGLTRSYAGVPSLTSLPGSTVHDITALTGARSKIRETLTIIAESASCY